VSYLGFDETAPKVDNRSGCNSPHFTLDMVYLLVAHNIKASYALQAIASAMKWQGLVVCVPHSRSLKRPSAPVREVALAVSDLASTHQKTALLGRLRGLGLSEFLEGGSTMR